ncbi:MULTISPECIES: hypothetical protein [Cupriavidus]
MILAGEPRVMAVSVLRFSVVAVAHAGGVRMATQACTPVPEARGDTAAARYLRTLQQFLQPYNTRRHAITVAAGEGRCGLRVDGVPVADKPARGLYRLLQDMDAALLWQRCLALDDAQLN